MANKYDKILGEYREADSVDLSGYVPTTRELTINGVTYDLSADRSWTVAAIPAGSDTQVQFNDGGTFGGDSGFTWNKTDNVLTLISGANTSGATPYVLKEPTGTYPIYSLFNYNNSGNFVASRLQMFSPTVAHNAVSVNFFDSADGANAGYFYFGVNGDSGSDNGTGVLGPNAFLRFGSQGTAPAIENLYIQNGTYGTIASWSQVGNPTFTNKASNDNLSLTLDTLSGSPYGSRVLFRSGGTLYGQIGGSGPITGIGGNLALRTDSSADLILLTNGNTERMRFSHTTQTALLTSQDAALKGLVIKGAASQTGNWLELQNSAGTPLIYTNLARLYLDGQAANSFLSLNAQGGFNGGYVVFYGNNAVTGYIGDNAPLQGGAANGFLTIRAESGKDIRFYTAGTSEHMRMLANTANTSFGTNKILFGTFGSEDTNLYRSAANTLKTDDDFECAALRPQTFALTNSTGNAVITANGIGVNYGGYLQIMGNNTITGYFGDSGPIQGTSPANQWLSITSTSNLPVKFYSGTGGFVFNDDGDDANFRVETDTNANAFVIDGGDDTVTQTKTIFTSTARLKGYTVATLPTGTQGDTAYVTDALAPTFLATVVGGGAVVTPVFYNGTNWVGY